VAVEPPARSTGVWYDAAIWAQFGEPLDSTTVSSQTVFLKQDTQRLAVRVDYDAASQRILIEPQVALPLNRTLTVELGPELRTADGRTFDQAYFWQFKTNGLRRVERIGPDDRSPFESPSVALLWTPTEEAAGPIQYQLYASPDSSQVAARTATAVTRTRAFYLPAPKWPTGTRMFWSVRAQNQTTGESLESPVWSFDTAPADAEIDSISVPLRWWGYYNRRSSVRTCAPATVSTFSDLTTVVRWQLEGVPRDVKLASVRMYATSVVSVAVARAPALLATLADMPFCDVQANGPPFSDNSMPAIIAGGTGNNPVFLHWESDFFTAHVQATITHGGFYGYLMTSNGTVSYGDPRLMLLFYRVPAPLAARSAAR